MVYVCTLSKELQEKARKELNEDPETRQQDIEHIRKWIQEQPHLNIRTDDFFILRFLRGCKFSLEKTKGQVDRYFTSRISLPEFFTGRDPQNPKIRGLLKLGLLLPLRNTNKEGANVFIFRPTLYDTKIYDFKDVVKTLYLILDTFFEVDEANQINGVGLLLDAKEFELHHIMHFSPAVLKNGFALWQDSYVVSNKFWIFINQGKIVHGFCNILKIFLKEELKKLIKMYGSDFEPIYETIPQSILPKEYGGDGESLQEITDYWLKIIDSKRDWILEDDEKNTVDESKRPKSKYH